MTVSSDYWSIIVLIITHWHFNWRFVSSFHMHCAPIVSNRENALFIFSMANVTATEGLLFLWIYFYHGNPTECITMHGECSVFVCGRWISCLRPDLCGVAVSNAELLLSGCQKYVSDQLNSPCAYD